MACMQVHPLQLAWTPRGREAMGDTMETHPSQGMISPIAITLRLWSSDASLCLPAPCACSQGQAGCSGGLHPSATQRLRHAGASGWWETTDDCCPVFHRPEEFPGAPAVPDTGSPSSSSPCRPQEQNADKMQLLVLSPGQVLAWQCPAQKKLCFPGTAQPSQRYQGPAPALSYEGLSQSHKPGTCPPHPDIMLGTVKGNIFYDL